MTFEPETADIRVGDVLLFHGSGFVASAIRFFDRTEWNHSAHVIGPDLVAQSDTDPGDLSRGVGTVPLQSRIDDADYVGICRLVSNPRDVAAVVTRTQWYLDRGDRYDYEAILLLMFLTTTRRIPAPRFFRWALRKILDGAASILLHMEARGKEPMICSAFTYKCFNEAIPDSDVDQYTIRVNAPPHAVAVSDRGLEGARANRGQGVSPDSLLARAAMRHALALPMSEYRFLEALPQPDPAVLRAELEPLLAEYLARAATVDPGDGGTIDDLADDEEILAALDRVVFTLARVTASNEQAIATRDAQAVVSARLAYRLFSDAVDNFVTPGDLSKTPDLTFIGRYHH